MDVDPIKNVCRFCHIRGSMNATREANAASTTPTTTPDNRSRTDCCMPLASNSVKATATMAPRKAAPVTLQRSDGVNDINEARAEITYNYIPRADAVLFLLDAAQVPLLQPGDDGTGPVPRPARSPPRGPARRVQLRPQPQPPVGVEHACAGQARAGGDGQLALGRAIECRRSEIFMRSAKRSAGVFVLFRQH